MKRSGAVGALALVVAFGVPAHAAGESEIVKLIEESARAMSALPKTRDRGAVLRLYAADYRGITDGEPQNRESLEAVVGEIDENVKLGNPVAITNRMSNVHAEAAGPFGWATYDFYSKIQVLGEVLGEVERRCTGVYGKRGESWTIRHEHCSTAWSAAPEPEEEDPPTNGPAVEG